MAFRLSFMLGARVYALIPTPEWMGGGRQGWATA